MPSLLPLLIIFLLPYSLSLAKVQQAPIIRMGSFITATNSGGSVSAWTSPSNRFAFGFYAVYDKFAVGIWFVINPTVIWTAERDGELHPEGTKLTLTKNGLRISKTTGDHPICNITINKINLASASMEDSGNFVIIDVNNGIRWQSFDYPTDTLIAGQLLRAGTTLVSSVSDTNHSSGRFWAAMQQDGNFVFYPANTPDTAFHAYWSSQTDGDGYTGVRLLDGSTFSLNKEKNATHSYSHGLSNLTFGRIDPDGFFRSYFINESFNTFMLFGFPYDGNKCSIKGACGSNSYCNYTAAAGINLPAYNDQGKSECLCLPGFVYADQSKPYMGCRMNFSMEQCATAADGAAATESNVTYSIIPLPSVSWNDDSYNYSDVHGEKDCRDSCLQDCNCYAALFVDRRCRKQRLPFLYGIQNPTAVAFLKAGSGEPLEILSPPPPNNVIENAPSTKTLLLTVALASSLIVAFSIAYFYFFVNLSVKRTWKNMETALAGGMAPRSFTYRQLVKATQNFSVILGKGGFSTVFKGKIPLGGGGNGEKSLMLIAVKRLDKLSAVNEKGFRNEMRAVGGAHHRNIVRLLGFCHEGSKWLLIYEYMSRGSLADLIFAPQDSTSAAGQANAEGKCRPGWKERVGIAMDVARGILYLHEECGSTIIHGDIKPENVLIAEDGTAKIGDLGLAKLLMPWQTKTYTRATGTLFYIAPEWGHGTEAVNSGVDVYSFGVLLLGLITCRKSFLIEAVNGCSLLSEWAYKCLNESTLEQLVPGGEEADMDELKKMVSVALWCVQKPQHRKSMKEVVRMLGGKMSVPMPPNHFDYHEGKEEPKVYKRTGLNSRGEEVVESEQQQEFPDCRNSLKEVVLMMRGKKHSRTSR